MVAAGTVASVNTLQSVLGAESRELGIGCQEIIDRVLAPLFSGKKGKMEGIHILANISPCSNDGTTLSPQPSAWACPIGHDQDT